jgi:ADP-heptose:LPS heptosyltransferase
MKRILIVKLSALGDVLQAMQAVKQWKVRTQQHLTWLVEARHASLLQSEGWIDEVLSVDTYQLRKNPLQIVQAFWRLRRYQFDEVYDLQGNIKSALLMLAIRAPIRVGMSFSSIPEKIALVGLNRFIKVNRSSPIMAQYQAILGADFDAAQRQGVFEKPRRMVILLGSRWENKKLPKEVWVKLIQEIRSITSLPIEIPYSGQQEYQQVLYLKEKCPELRIIPEREFKDLKELFDPSTKVVGVDSALLHLAAYQGADTFGVFGPSSGQVYTPSPKGYWQGACIEGVQFIKRCPYLRTCPHGSCLKKVDLDSLIQTLKLWLTMD